MSAPPLLFTPAGTNLPSEPAGTFQIQCLKGNGEGGGGAGGGCRGKKHGDLSCAFFLLFSLKGDLRWSDPPRFIPKTYHLHMTVSAISTEQDV